jgi:hypothetical protein
MATTVISRSEDHLYSIDSDPVHYYWTGITNNSNQALVIIHYPAIIGIFFKNDGEITTTQQRLLSSRTRDVATRFGLREAFAQEDEVFHSWMEAIGFHQQVIRVKRFFSPEYHIGILDFPQLFTDILQHPTHYSEDEYRVAERELDRWSRLGLFELWLNDATNIWIDQSGEIESS